MNVRLLTLMALLFWSLAPTAHAQPQKTVVVISTEDLSAPQAMRASLQDRATILPENLDFVHFGSESYQLRLNAWSRNKYAGQKVDALVTIGSGALRFMAESRPQIWPDVPVVFIAVTARVVKTIQLPHEVTGIVGALRHSLSIIAFLHDLCPHFSRLDGSA
jgi:hypothetical protein